MRFMVVTATVLLSLQTVWAAELKVCIGGHRAERRVTCLVDGDTGWEAGVKWRLKDVDTPEYASHAECRQETGLAIAATYRMLELMKAGYRIEWLHLRDRSKRELVNIRLADGRDAGATLIAEGHAVPWPNGPRAWCE